MCEAELYAVVVHRGSSVRSGNCCCYVKAQRGFEFGGDNKGGEERRFRINVTLVTHVFFSVV